MDMYGIGAVAATLLDYVEEGRTFQGAGVKTLPSAIYTDPARWQAEMAMIFKRVPLVLAASAELPATGSWKAFEAMGLPLLLTRDRAGVVRAFLNVCPHRGGPVADDGHGQGTRFACRYHGWTFGADGRLIGVADPAKFGAIDREARGLRALPCEERAGLILGVLTPGAPLDGDAFYGAMLDDFTAMDLASWAYLGTRVIHGANWKIAFDGYLEGYHFAQLHPDTIHPRTPSNVTHYEAFGPHLRIGFPQVGIASLRDHPRDTWGSLENRGFDFVRILFPNVSLFLAPEITQIAQLFPGPTPDRNMTVLTFLRRDPPRDDADRTALTAMMDWLRDVVRDEDYAMGARIQAGMASGAHETVILGRNERGNQFFHEWVDWYLADDPAAPKPVL